MFSFVASVTRLYVDQVTRLNILRAVLVRTEVVDTFDLHQRSPLIWAATAGNLTPSARTYFPTVLIVNCGSVFLFDL